MAEVKILNKPKTIKFMKAEVDTKFYFISHDQTSSVNEVKK